MYGFEHDPDDRAKVRYTLSAELVVLLVPAAIMIAGFVVAVFIL